MKVIGTDLYENGMNNAVAEFIRLSQDAPKNHMVSPSDANVLVHARRVPEFKAVVQRYFWNLPDGVPSVWVLRMKGAKAANRCSGPDFFKQVIEQTKDLPIKHFLCGGAEGTAKQLAEVCASWGNENVVGYYSPPFKDFTPADYKTMADQINAVNTNVLWVGLGAPKQLYFSDQISKHTNVQFIVPVGAAFDFHVGNVKKAPNWIQKVGMEWFFRLCQEPRRLAKRYFKVVPFFIWYNFVDLFKRS